MRIEEINVEEAGIRGTAAESIPIGWVKTNLDSILLSSDYGTSEPTNELSGIPVLRMGNLENGKIKTDELVYLDMNEDDLNKYRLQKGDLLFNRTNSQDLVGKVALFDLEGEYVFASYLVRLVVNSELVDPAYLNYYMNTYKAQITIGKIATKGVQQVNVNPTTLRKYFTVMYPPKDEQKIILAILKTWDRAINLKEKLLDQKKLQKKGLAQRLLTGKTRLPGFNVKWQEIRAGQIFKNSSNKTHGGVGEVLSSMQDQGIVPRNQVNIDIKYDLDSVGSYKKVDIGDFVISLRSFQGGIEYSEYEGLISPAYTVLKNKLLIDHGFYKELFKSTDFIRRLNSVIYGIRDGKQIGFDDFAMLNLPYPEPTEQTAISEVLATASYEIRTLSNEIEQIKIQKKELMQLLLTGKIRVPENLEV